MKNLSASQIVPGNSYDFDPPAIILGETFKHAVCEHDVPGHPDEFVFKGVPEKGGEAKSFVIRFSAKGSVGVHDAEAEPPKLNLVPDPTKTED